MSNNSKKVAVKPRVILLMLTFLSILFFGILGINNARKQMAFSNTFEACAKPAPPGKNYGMLLDPDNIPCYQKALQA